MKLLNKKGEINPGAIFATVVTIIISVYVVFVLVKAFVEMDPSFGRYGWPILGSLVIGVIAFLRSGGLFK